MQPPKQNSPEWQPTQRNALEQQSTLPMDLEQRSTLPMTAASQNIEQQSISPLLKQASDRSKKALRWWVYLLLCILLTGGILTGYAITAGWFPHITSNNGKPVSRTQRQPIQRHVPLVDSTAKHFMDAMMHKDWATMWSMLSPDTQQLWQGEKDFTHFEQAKFGALTFITYSDGPTQIETTWLDPDTTRVYSDVATLHVSLEISTLHGLLSQPTNYALNQGLFNNTLFALSLYQSTWRVLIAGPADLEAPILVPASPPTTKLLVPIFMYHHVSDLPVKDLLDYNLTVTTADFNAQLTWLQRQGYHSITQTELFDALYYGKALPAHPMMLTFDDGYEDMYTGALPALLAHHFRGVFYIITGMIGGNYMTWEQVRTLAHDGMQIASHTVHHVNVGRPPAGTTTQQELNLSKLTLQTRLGQPVQFFCYPVGEPFHHDTLAEQQMVLNDLFIDGYVGATLDPFSFDSAIQNAQTPYQLPRIRVSGGESLSAFTGILNFTLEIGAERLKSRF